MEVSFYARLSALSSHRPRHGTLVYPSPFYADSPPSASLFPSVMASVHIIVDGENANRENAEYAV